MLGVEPPDHAVGRSRGGLSMRIHQLVDGNGLPLVILLTAGQTGDSLMFLPLMQQLRVLRSADRFVPVRRRFAAIKRTRPARSEDTCVNVASPR